MWSVQHAPHQPTDIVHDCDSVEIAIVWRLLPQQRLPKPTHNLPCSDGQYQDSTRSGGKVEVGWQLTA